jgi:uncharacterized membrane protein YkgB
VIAVRELDLRLIGFFKRAFLPFARVALFVVFFWFGALKILGLSPASPLAQALTANTVGLQYFDVLFMLLSVVECVIGVLFLIPKATRIVIPLLLFHMAVVCAPLILVPGDVWTGFLVPTLEGQYIIKNLVIIAVAIGIAAQTPPLFVSKSGGSSPTKKRHQR